MNVPLLLCCMQLCTFDMYTYTCKYMNFDTHVYTYIYLIAYMCKCMYKCIYVYIFFYMCMHMYIYISSYVTVSGVFISGSHQGIYWVSVLLLRHKVVICIELQFFMLVLCLLFY